MQKQKKNSFIRIYGNNCFTVFLLTSSDFRFSLRGEFRLRSSDEHAASAFRMEFDYELFDLKR